MIGLNWWKRLSLPVLFLSYFMMGNVVAEQSAYDKAHYAVTSVLFDYDNSDQYASFTVSGSGYVDITFASDIPEYLYDQIVNKLKKHPDIRGVLAGKGASACGLF